MNLWGWAALGLLTSFLVSALMVRAGIGDVPEARKNHKKVTPTGAGIALVATMGVLAFFLPSADYSSSWPQLLSLIWAMAFLGFVDDLYILPPLLKFFVMAILAALAVWIIGPVTRLPSAMGGYDLPYIAGFAGSVLWVFVVTNIVNFMDGSNGMMVTVMAIASLALGVVGFFNGGGDAAFLPIILAIGLVGILPFNFRKSALIFSGDVGSITAGFTFAIAALWIDKASVLNLAYVGPVLILTFLADGLLTMLMRLRRGENLLHPHRTHLYQRLCTAGLSHPLVAFIYGLLGLALAGTTIWAVSLNFQGYVSYLFIPVAIVTAGYFWASRRVN